MLFRSSDWYFALDIAARCCPSVSCNGACRERYPFLEATGILPWILLPDAAHRYLAKGHVANGIHFSGQPTSCPTSTGFHTVFLVVWFAIAAIHDLGQVSSLFRLIVLCLMVPWQHWFLPFGTVCSCLGTVPCIAQPRLVQRVVMPFLSNLWIGTGFC